MKTEVNVSATATVVASAPVSTRTRAASRGRKRGRPYLPPFSKKTVSVPLADYQVLQWWANQLDPSASIRVLIHDEIRDHGVVDRIARMSAPLPRRDNSAYDVALLREGFRLTDDRVEEYPR